MNVRRAAAVVALASLAGLAPSGVSTAQTAPLPIPGPLDGPLPRFTGAPTTAAPLRVPAPAVHPVLAPDGESGTGLSAANGGASPHPGPLGRGTRSTSAFLAAACTGIGFVEGRIVAACAGPLGGTLRLVDRETLATLASLPLPGRGAPERTDLGGGPHFVVRRDGTLLVPTHAGTLLHVDATDGALRVTGTTDLRGVLAPRERVFAVGAGHDGRDWVAGSAGTVVTVPRDGGAPRALSLGGEIAEDVATSPDGTFVVTSSALHRLVAERDGTPRVVWRLPVHGGTLDRGAGRTDGGSGTPPVVLPDGKVAVADARNPPRIVVARVRGPESRRLACLVDVLGDRRAIVEAHLVAAGRSLVVANGYGNVSLFATEGGRTTVGGLARVVVGRRGCRVAWRSEEVSPSSQAVVSRATGLLYTLTKPAGFPDAWNLTAIDWRTGATRFSALAGEGLGYNADAAPLVLGPDGAAYAGVFGGLVRFVDAPG